MSWPRSQTQVATIKPPLEVAAYASLSFGYRCWLRFGHLLLERSAGAAANPPYPQWASSVSLLHKTAHRIGFVLCYFHDQLMRPPSLHLYLSNQMSHPIPTLCALSPELALFPFSSSLSGSGTSCSSPISQRFLLKQLGTHPFPCSRVFYGFLWHRTKKT